MPDPHWSQGLSLGIVFGIKWYMGRGSINAIFRRIEERQIGPGGDAGNQLQPAALAQLPPVAPPPAIEIVGNVIPLPQAPAPTPNPAAPQEGQ